jgi:thioredoxin-like negative regulator of GroEL
MNPVVAELAKQYKVCKVNTESNPALAAKFDVSAIPTLRCFAAARSSGGTRASPRKRPSGPISKP